jgi:hypothetical protein
MLKHAPNFEKFLKRKGILTIYSGGVSRDSWTVDEIKFNYRLFVNEKIIGKYTESRKVYDWGSRLIKMAFHGEIPGYKFKIGDGEHEEFTLECEMVWGRGYTKNRIDSHKSIPFP